MDHSAHRRPRPQRAAPQKSTSRVRLYGLHKNSFKLRGNRYQRDRNYLAGQQNLHLPNDASLPEDEPTVPSHSLVSDLDEANLDATHIDGAIVAREMREVGVKADRRATSSRATPTEPLIKHSLTKQDGRQLADLILKRIQNRLAGRIRNLAIHITNHSVELTGECRTYYTKQMAQHVAMGVLDYQQLVNNIVVC